MGSNGSKLSPSMEKKTNSSCIFCLSLFANIRNCNRHEKICGKNKERLCGEFTCFKCQAFFSRKDSLNKHTKNCNVDTSVQSDVNTNSVDKSPPASRPKKAKTPCLVKSCNKKFYHKSALINHLSLAHQDEMFLKDRELRNFSTYEEFVSWKEEEEKTLCLRFTQKRGKKDRQYIYYYCQHDGSDKLHFKKKTSRCNKKGRIKCGDFCIAKMKVKRNEGGSVEVEYFPTHSHRYNSSTDFIHHALPESTSNHSCSQQEANIGFSASPQHVDVRHQQGLQIADELITEVIENTWEIRSSSDKKLVYVVLRLSLTCDSDHCFSKCTNLQCVNLCSHLFTCDCLDHHPLCKHIHKLHSFLTQKLARPSILEQPDLYTLSLEGSTDSTPTPSTQSSRKQEALISRIGSHLQYLTNLHTSLTKNETTMTYESLTQFDTILSNLVFQIENE